MGQESEDRKSKINTLIETREENKAFDAMKGQEQKYNAFDRVKAGRRQTCINNK